MQKIFKIILSKAFMLCFAIVLQIAVIVTGIIFLSGKFVYLGAALTVFGLIVVLYILNKPENPSYKLAWIIPIALVPVCGGLLYLIFGVKHIDKRLIEQNNRIMEEAGHFTFQDEEVLEELKAMNPRVLSQIKYLGTPQRGLKSHNGIATGIFPVYKHTETRYLGSGEDFFRVLMEELEKAESYIFMEYFIIEEGKLWNSIHELLRRKANQGVDVRLVFDDLGCLMKLPSGYYKKLKREGIKCRVFNPVGPKLTRLPFMNNRDHRKITVIDGVTGFTGGINLADEYMNETHPFGHWKDTSVMLKGAAVWSLTTMFMHMWNLCGPYKEFDYENYIPNLSCRERFFSDGYVVPYCDSPLDTEIQAEMVYLNMINKAESSVYITTPYLVIDNELATALMLAAKNGVDVRLMLPGVFDKWYMKLCSRAAYQELIRAGVRIFEYTPGFVHAKTFVCDGEVATIGTVNMDYRSLYLHFECGVFMYKSSAVSELQKDYVSTLEACREITEEDCMSVNFVYRIVRSILKVFAPLM